MSESLVRRHGLEPLLAAPGKFRAAEPAVTVTVRGDLGHINLRGRASDPAFLQVAEQELGAALPVEPNTVSDGEYRVCWLGPDEWLVVAPVANAANLAQRLEKALSSSHAAVNDISGGHVALILEGPGCRDLLARGCIREPSASATVRRAALRRPTYSLRLSTTRRRSWSWFAAALRTTCAGGWPMRAVTRGSSFLHPEPGRAPPARH